MLPTCIPGPRRHNKQASKQEKRLQRATLKTMQFQGFLRRGALLGTAAAAALIMVSAAWAQPPRPVAAVAAPASPEAAAPAACAVTIEQVRFAHPLPRIGRRLAAGKPIKIVALGSS